MLQTVRLKLEHAGPPREKSIAILHFHSAVVVHRSLAADIDAAGFTGTAWIALTDYAKSNPDLFRWT